jgi:hypothetical protein
VSVPPKHFYRRNLPHIQRGDAAHFISFDTYKRWALPYKARDIVMRALLHFDGAKIQAHAAVVMPEHAHLICTFLVADNGTPFSMAEVMHSIKSFTAHEINKHLHRTGSVWQDESFDHVIRREEGIGAKVEYLK